MNFEGYELFLLFYVLPALLNFLMIMRMLRADGEQLMDVTSDDRRWILSTCVMPFANIAFVFVALWILSEESLLKERSLRRNKNE